MSYFDDGREKILTAALSTVQIQVDIIQALLTSNRKLQDGLSAATREIKRLSDRVQASRNIAIA